MRRTRQSGGANHTTQVTLPKSERAMKVGVEDVKFQNGFIVLPPEKYLETRSAKVIDWQINL
jgi:Flp pilus assembly protein CpaB